MADQIIISSDSTTDLGAELLQRYHIHILPLQVTLGEKTYRDGIDITPDAIYAHCEATGQLPQTAAPNIADHLAFFSALRQEGEVVHFTISSEMSSSFQNARAAALELGGVYVVDTRNLSTGGGLLVVAAAEMAQQGLSAAEIAEKCTALAERVSASFVIDDLTYLHKGGRCSALAALGANLLQLKPCIAVSGGKMDVSKKYRGKFAGALRQYIADQLGDGSGIVPNHIFVTHAGCDSAVVDACLAQVQQLLPQAQEIHVTRAGCTVSSHCGRNCLGVLFIRSI